MPLHSTSLSQGEFDDGLFYIGKYTQDDLNRGRFPGVIYTPYKPQYFIDGFPEALSPSKVSFIPHAFIRENGEWKENSSIVELQNTYTSLLTEKILDEERVGEDKKNQADALADELERVYAGGKDVSGVKIEKSLDDLFGKPSIDHRSTVDKVVGGIKEDISMIQKQGNLIELHRSQDPIDAYLEFIGDDVQDIKRAFMKSYTITDKDKTESVGVHGFAFAFELRKLKKVIEEKDDEEITAALKEVNAATLEVVVKRNRQREFIKILGLESKFFQADKEMRRQLVLDELKRFSDTSSISSARGTNDFWLQSIFLLGEEEFKLVVQNMPHLSEKDIQTLYFGYRVSKVGLGEILIGLEMEEIRLLQIIFKRFSSLNMLSSELEKYLKEKPKVKKAYLSIKAYFALTANSTVSDNVQTSSIHRSKEKSAKGVNRAARKGVKYA